MRSGFGIFALGVNFGNEDGRFGGEVRSNLLPDRGEGFTVLAVNSQQSKF